VLYDFSGEKPLVSPDGWMETLLNATPRKGGTARCVPSARPGAGVRAVRQFWRRGDASSYDRALHEDVYGEPSSSGTGEASATIPTIPCSPRLNAVCATARNPGRAPHTTP
jgi:hypothetical protein